MSVKLARCASLAPTGTERSGVTLVCIIEATNEKSVTIPAKAQAIGGNRVLIGILRIVCIGFSLGRRNSSGLNSIQLGLKFSPSLGTIDKAK
jgi:hypothetical protein